MHHNSTWKIFFKLPSNKSLQFILKKRYSSIEVLFMYLPKFNNHESIAFKACYQTYWISFYRSNIIKKFEYVDDVLWFVHYKVHLLQFVIFTYVLFCHFQLSKNLVIDIVFVFHSINVTWCNKNPKQTDDIIIVYVSFWAKRISETFF